MTKCFKWTATKFGRHKGKTLPQILLKDADWFYLGLSKGIFGGRLGEEADDIASKACRVKIPKSDPENWRIEYRISFYDNFSGFSVIDEKSAAYPSENSKISGHLDLSLPYGLKKYDKFGNQIMLKNFRGYYFDGKRLMKDRCERFFLDDRKFLVA